MAYLETLPDPTTNITQSGKAGGTYGPGFSNIGVSLKQPAMSNVTNSNRYIGRAIAAGSWAFDISYNPMTKQDFSPVYYFLLHKSSLNPFYLKLPQHANPTNSVFSAYAQTSNFTATGDVNAGSKVLTFSDLGYAPTTTDGVPTVGDMFNIGDSNHTKIYQVLRVETSADYEGVQPSTSQVRVTFTPGLSKKITTSSEIVFKEPKARVVQKAKVNEYQLNTENLYSFSLKLEEIN